MDILTVNGIWGGGSTPPVARFFCEKIGNLYAYDFYTLPLKFYQLTLKKIKALAAPGSCHVTSSRQG